MIRTSMVFSANALTVRNLNAYDHLITNGPRIQCVRWKRKPIWLPTAKSKVFRVPTRPVIPEEDYNELKRLHNNYRTQMKSILNFFEEQEEIRKQNFDEATVNANIEKDFEICSYLNNTWNEQSAMLRTKRLAVERERRFKEIDEKLEAKAIRDKQIQIRVDTEIKKAKEQAPTFITQENIDEAIRKALETVVDHNVAIDIHGNPYKDKPENVSSKTTV
ncbi:probable 28S ribosomal protein S26, mitochondrial [Ceratina calcarata]|uniref:Small ribosomal subunit protein mS26 n=1 Tax=Ceratina calcarata TaxID=156304 RepID=A0AAJ7J2R0_9HYME|nr:probable 28S ribosomal protein S26, mitochondrial [Ceratina calcarata]XP_026674228.1 probable 28S ribosomal protein S26, mitochondrial [Ceratina calcarata]